MDGRFRGAVTGTAAAVSNAVSGLDVANGGPGINLLNGSVPVISGTVPANATAIQSNSYTTLNVSGTTFAHNHGTAGGPSSPATPPECEPFPGPPSSGARLSAGGAWPLTTSGHAAGATR